MTQGCLRDDIIGIKTGFSDWSVPVAIKMVTRPNAPSPVSNVTATGALESIVVSWDAPTTVANGDPLKIGALSHYNVYIGTTPGIDTTNPATYTSKDQHDSTRYPYTVPDPASYTGPFYFVVTAQDISGNESTPSAEVSASGTDQTAGPASVDDWATGNASSILVGRGRIHVQLRLPKSTWSRFAHYNIYYDVDTGGGFSGSWTYLASERIMHPHAPLTLTSAYKYLVTVVGEDGTETSGTTHDNGGAGYTPNAADQSAILADTVSAGHIIAAYDLIAGTLIGGTLQSTNWSSSAGSQLDLDNGTLQLGGSSSPAFSVDASGVLTATGASISGTVTITSGSGIGNLSDSGDLALLDVVGNAKITDLSFSKLTAGTNTASLTIGSSGYIKSSNYSPGSAGFKIEGDGDAEFSDVTVRGKLIANVAGSEIPWSYVTGVNLTVGDLTVNDDMQFYTDGSRHAIKGINDLYFSSTKSTTYPYVQLGAGGLTLNSGASSGNDITLTATDDITLSAGDDLKLFSSGDVQMTHGSGNTECVSGVLKYVGATNIYSGNAPTDWTNLDLTSYVGTRRALVLLVVENNGVGANNYRFRTDNTSYVQEDQADNYPGAFSCRCDSGDEHNYVWCLTSVSGFIEWSAVTSASTDLDLLCYIAA